MQANSAEAALPADLQARLGAIWRQESARIVATVLRRVRDLGLAEEIAQDAWLAALEHWPRQGLPDNPGDRLRIRRGLDDLAGAEPLAARGQRADPAGQRLVGGSWAVRGPGANRRRGPSGHEKSPPSWGTAGISGLHATSVEPEVVPVKGIEPSTFSLRMSG